MMDITLEVIAKQFRQGHEATAAVYEADSVTWWPRLQSDATTLAWSIGLQWMADITNDGWWLWSAWGSGPTSKAKLLDKYRVQHTGPESRRPPDTGRAKTRCFYPRQYLVDFCAGPKLGNKMLLTMESEVYHAHGVGHDIVPTNDYVWDFAKLLYIQSPLRIFIARVGTSETLGSIRREMLWSSLTKLCASDDFDMTHPLVVYVLAQGKKKRGESMGGLWNVGQRRFDRIPLLGADAS